MPNKFESSQEFVQWLFADEEPVLTVRSYEIHTCNDQFIGIFPDRLGVLSLPNDNPVMTFICKDATLQGCLDKLLTHCFDIGLDSPDKLYLRQANARRHGLTGTTE